MSSGFQRLRRGGLPGAALACFAGLGALGGGSARAVSNPQLSSVSRQSIASGTGVVSGNWQLYHVHPGSSWPSSVATTSGFNLNKTADGNMFRAIGIKDATLDGLGKAFDQTMVMGFADGYLFGNPIGDPDITLDRVDDAQGGVTLSSPYLVKTRPGLSVRAHYYVPADSMIMRIIYEMRSDFTASAINTRAVLTGNLGSDADTTIQATADGNLQLNDGDLWFITNNNPSAGADSVNQPTVTISRFGSDSLVVPVNNLTFTPGSGMDQFLSAYDISIPYNSTRRLMVFVALNKSIADAQQQASWFETTLQAASYGLPAPGAGGLSSAAPGTGLMAGLSAAEISTILNYAPDGEGDLIPDSVDNCPAVINSNQSNQDGDIAGDACDAFPLDPTETTDTDGDGVGDNGDNCPRHSNPDQADSDGNGIGNACDEPPKRGSLHPLTLLVVIFGSLLMRVRRLTTVSGDSK